MRGWGLMSRTEQYELSSAERLLFSSLAAVVAIAVGYGFLLGGRELARYGHNGGLEWTWVYLAGFAFGATACLLLWQVSRPFGRWAWSVINR